jgi:transposase
MPAPYSQDLRDRVVAAVRSGTTADAAAERFGISLSTVARWMGRWRAEGHAEARSMGGDQRSRLTAYRDAVLTLVATEPDLTLEEIRRQLLEQYGIGVGLTTVWRFLTAHKISFKKKPARCRAGAV